LGRQTEKKIKTTTTLICWDALTGVIVLNFGMRGDITDVIMMPNFMLISSFQISDTINSALLHRLIWSPIQQ